MKGRSSFTPKEVERIRALLRQKADAPRSTQKAVRARMRSLGFYVSDFGAQDSVFTESDLDRLIDTGRIKVAGRPNRSWLQRLRNWWRAR